MVVAATAVTGRRLAAAAAIAAALVAAAVVLEVALPRWRAGREAKRSVLWSGRGAFGSFTIERDGGTWLFEPRSSGGWSLRATGMPRDLVADVRSVEEIKKAISGFGGIRTVLAEDVASVANVADLGQYGLAEPRLLFRWTDDWQRPRILAIGDVLPGDSQIAAIVDRERLVLLPREVRDAIDRDLAVFRAKAIVSLSWSDVERIGIERRRSLPEGASPRILLERRHDAAAPPDSWRLTEPMTADASGARAGSLVSKLTSLMAAGFGAEEPAQADLAAAGLAPPAVSVTLELAQAPSAGATRERVTIDIGDAAGEGLAWCRTGTGPLVQVRGDLRDDLLLADDFFRDNRPVRLPRANLINLRLEKGVDSIVRLEIQRDEGEDRQWYAVEPRGLDLPPIDAERLITLLDGIRCGRFEDEMSAQPGSADVRWDFAAEGALRIRASALLPDGRPLRVDLDATPFMRQRELYYAVRTIDQDLKEEICIARIKAFDDLLERARAIALPEGPAIAAPADE